MPRNSHLMIIIAATVLLLAALGCNAPFATQNATVIPDSQPSLTGTEAAVTEETAVATTDTTTACP